MTECWREIVWELKAFLPSPEAINEIFECLVPTNVKVIDGLRVEPTNGAERDCFKHLTLYIRGLDQSKLKKFLKFTTGSELMLFNELQVIFNQLENASRRPIAHTCSCILEIPSTYTSFPELREDFTNILNANDWEMDII